MYALALVWRERAGGQVEAPGLAAAPLAHVAISMIAETAKRPLLLRQPQKCTAWATPKMRRRCSRCRPNACSSKNRLLPPPHQVHVAQSEGGLTRVLEVDAQVGPAGLQGREAGGGAAALKPRALRRQCSDCRAATHAEIFPSTSSRLSCASPSKLLARHGQHQPGFEPLHTAAGQGCQRHCRPAAASGAPCCSSRDVSPLRMPLDSVWRGGPAGSRHEHAAAAPHAAGLQPTPAAPRPAADCCPCRAEPAGGPLGRACTAQRAAMPGRAPPGLPGASVRSWHHVRAPSPQAAPPALPTLAAFGSATSFAYFTMVLRVGRDPRGRWRRGRGVCRARRPPTARSTPGHAGANRARRRLLPLSSANSDQFTRLQPASSRARACSRHLPSSSS